MVWCVFFAQSAFRTTNDHYARPCAQPPADAHIQRRGAMIPTPPHTHAHTHWICINIYICFCKYIHMVNARERLRQKAACCASSDARERGPRRNSPQKNANIFNSDLSEYNFAEEIMCISSAVERKGTLGSFEPDAAFLDNTLQRNKKKQKRTLGVWNPARRTRFFVGLTWKGFKSHNFRELSVTILRVFKFAFNETNRISKRTLDG